MTYTPRPNAQGDTLVNSRNPIRTNFQVIQDRWEVNHQPINTGGKHKFVQMPNQATIPAGLVVGDGTSYVKTAQGTSQLFFTNENSGNEYQLTRTSNAEFASFGNKAGVNNSGWTFLPGRGSAGAMLFQYGIRSIAIVGTATTVTFPKSFTSAPFSIVLTLVKSGTSPTRDTVHVRDGSVQSSQFQIVTTETAGAALLCYWQAIGV